MSLIKGISHAGFWVKDLDRALDFYCGKLGGKEAFNLLNDDGSIWIQYIEIAPRQFIELFPDSNTGQATDVKLHDDQSFFHIALEVEDLDSTITQLNAKGVLVYNAPDDAHAGKNPIDHAGIAKCNSKTAWIVDADGNNIEFMEFRPDSLHLNFEGHAEL